MAAVTSREHLQHAAALRRLMAAYASAEDLIRIGAYQKGSDPELDHAIELRPLWNQVLQQKPQESEPLAAAIARLMALPAGGRP
jgi:flagellum-specific ATP synthase